MAPVVLTLSSDQVTAVVAAAGAPAPAPVPVVVPPPTVASTLPQHVLWDGPSGVRGDVWDDKYPYLWHHRGGDWVDAKGVAQGTAPFATFTLNSAQTNVPFSCDVTSLVAKQISASKNRGMYLYGGGPGYSAYAARLAGRTSATPPSVTVVTDQGTYVCPATCTGHTTNNATQSGATNNTAETSVGGGGNDNGLWQFDYSAVLGTVQKATLAGQLIQFWKLNVGSIPVAVYEPDTPDIALPGDVGPAVPGIGTGQRWSTLATHPAVIFHTGNDYRKAPWSDPYFGPASMVSSVLDVDGTYALRTGYAPGSDLGGGSESRMVCQGAVATGLELPQRNTDGSIKQVPIFRPNVLEPDLWVSNDVFLESSYADKVTACKFVPGLRCEYGFWVADAARPMGGYWYGLTGNGGAYGMGTVGYEGNTPGMLGHWERSHIDCDRPDANPFNGLFYDLRFYPYNIDQTAVNPDLEPWRSLAGGLVAGLIKQRKFRLEVHARMNSIRPMTQAEFDADMAVATAKGWIARPTFNAATGFDSWNNGQAVADGLLEAYVDGVLCYRKSTFRWVRNPWYAGWEAACMDRYHGGQGALMNILVAQYLRLGRMGVSRLGMGTGILPG